MEKDKASAMIEIPVDKVLLSEENEKSITDFGGFPHGPMMGINQSEDSLISGDERSYEVDGEHMEKLEPA